MESGVTVMLRSFLLSDSPVQIWAQQWSWGRPACLPPSVLSSSALPGSRWRPAAPGCDTVTPEWHVKVKRAQREVTTRESGLRRRLVPAVDPVQLEVNLRLDQHRLPRVEILLDLQQQLLLCTAERQDGWWPSSPAASLPAAAPSWASHRSPTRPGRGGWRCRPRCRAAGWGRPRPAGSPGRPGVSVWRSCTPAPSAARLGRSELPQRNHIGSVTYFSTLQSQVIVVFFYLRCEGMSPL